MAIKRLRKIRGKPWAKRKITKWAITEFCKASQCLLDSDSRIHVGHAQQLS
jgi:hypothetical protein